jgi:hypothetical protein
MRASGEESVSLLSIFSRCITAKYVIPLKRLAIYNLYARFSGDDFQVTDHTKQTEITMINSMGSSDPLTVFLDDPWRVHSNHPAPYNLKMLRIDTVDKEGSVGLARFTGLERLYFVGKRKDNSVSKASSTTATPTTPSHMMSSVSNGNVNANGTPNMTEQRCRTTGSDYLAVIQTNHRTMRHLLLSDYWQLSEDALFRLCQFCPDLEQLGFSCLVPPLESLRQILALVPKLWAMRLLIRPGSEFDMMDPDVHVFAIATEFWRPEYKNLKYISMGDDLIFKLGGVYYPPKGKEKATEGNENSFNAKKAGPIRRVQVVSRESVRHVEIWGMDTAEFDPECP